MSEVSFIARDGVSMRSAKLELALPDYSNSKSANRKTSHGKTGSLKPRAAKTNTAAADSTVA